MILVFYYLIHYLVFHFGRRREIVDGVATLHIYVYSNLYLCPYICKSTLHLYFAFAHF